MNIQTITLAGGCFWCTEAVFKRLRGVQSVVPGYANGDGRPATYERVCSGRSGYAEAIQITFDTTIINLETMLDVFWAVHDPTSLNRQDNDQGTEYRSGIYYDTPEQLPIIKAAVDALETSTTYDKPIVTEVEPLRQFFPAEEYHRDYYDQNRQQGYCRIIIDPKIEKLTKHFVDRLA